MLHLLLYDMQLCLLCATELCVVLHLVSQHNLLSNLLVSVHDNLFAHAVRRPLLLQWYDCSL